MVNDTDGDVLTMLRGDSHCPADVLTLATEAAAKGLLVAAFDRAWDGMTPDMIGSSKMK